ncbi:NfeD family protein [Parabacteroides sp. OttesenSCG-928-B22]|nr:NfeD family protein [Parabacteroides sp. OttesenSCG-928-B22]
MEFDVWHIWIIIALVLLVIEIFSTGFIMASLAIGCVFAGIVTALGCDFKIQLIAFSIGTLISFFAARPFMLKYAHKKANTVNTNVDALAGKIGRVHEVIDVAQNTGRVILGGDDWKAVSVNEEVIDKGEKVRVLKVDSTILIVEHIKD